MAQRNYRNTRRSRLPGLLLAGGGLLALTLFGIVGTLWLAGVPLNPFAASQKEDPYMVRIPINARPIPAYSRVDRTHLLNPADRSLMFQRIPPQAALGMAVVGVDQSGSHVEDRVVDVKNVNDEVVFVVAGGREVRQAQTFTLGGAILNINAIIGRVVKADKRAGLGFQESTFFPQGTPEGLAGATPEGMRAITLDATRLTGVHSLNAGDMIDLLASVPTDEDDNDDESNESEVELLAQNAHVLRPVYVRNEVTSSASLMNGQTTQNLPKYEVAIAVAADDVIRLQTALNQSLSITCVAHSMKPTGGSEQKPPAPDHLVRVPVTVRPILAYQVVSRDAFVSPATRSLKTATIPRQLADRLGAITSVDQAIGAITRQDIPAGRYLRQSDLLKGPPTNQQSADNMVESSLDGFNHSADGKRFVALLQQQQPAPAATAVGDRPAISRFIPAGRTAFAIPLNRVYGAEHLQIGDSIDLLASFSLERLRDEEETETRPDGTVIVRKSESLTPRTTRRSWEESFGNRAEPWFVATGAIVVAPVGFPAPAAALRAIESNTENSRPSQRDKTFEGPPVIIAVENRDVETVATALATRDALFTVAFHADENNVARPQDKTIAIASEPMDAYSPLSETSWQGNRRRVATRVVSSANPRFQDALTPQQLQSYFGRTLSVEKNNGDFFTPADFMPEGAGQGIGASVRQGYTLLPVADRDVEGIDSFVRNDTVTIMIRAVFKSKLARQVNAEDGVAASFVVAETVRVVRESVGGQSIIEVRNEDLARLQAAMARSLTDRDEMRDRSHLVAVGSVPTNDTTSSDSKIAPFDPLTGVKTTQLIIGGERSVKVFGGQ